MAQDFSRLVRRAILPALKASGDITSLIPAASIYPVTVPANASFPFIRYGASIALPFRAAGLDSSTIKVAIHAFTKGVTDATGALQITAEDHASLIAETVGSTLDELTLPLGGGYHARVIWTGSNILIDGDEIGAWHAIVNISVDVSG